MDRLAMDRLADQRRISETLNKAEDIVKERDPYKSKLVKLFIRIRDISSERSEWVQDLCKELFMRDYRCKFMCNLNRNVPGVDVKLLMIPVARKDGMEDATEMNSYVEEFLRHDLDPFLTRFPCPAILFNGKYICRAEYPNILKDDYEDFDPPIDDYDTKERIAFVRKDEKFLASLGISDLIHLPDANESDFEGYVTTSGNLKSIYKRIKIRFMKYPDRDGYDNTPESITKITKEYLSFMLRKLARGKGLLIQSLCGQFRSSLFISLLRLSLWADGVIHENLNVTEIATLSLGYDWYLFGRRMNEKKCSSIKMMSFAHLLREISTDEFSVTKMIENRNKLKISSGIPKFQASRREVLKELSSLLLECFYKSTQYINSV